MVAATPTPAPAPQTHAHPAPATHPTRTPATSSPPIPLPAPAAVVNDGSLPPPTWEVSPQATQGAPSTTPSSPSTPSTSSSSSPSPAHPTTCSPAHPTCPLAPLTPADADLLRLYFASARNIFTLADSANKPLDHTLRWLAQPHIQHAIDLIAASEREGLRSAALALLHQVAAQTDDPVEKRRATTALLRATSPRPPAPSPLPPPKGEVPPQAGEGAPSTTRSSPSTPSSSTSSSSPSPAHPSTSSPAHPPPPPLHLLPSPNPAVSPEHTVVTLLTALARNHNPFQNAGIATLKKFWDPQHEVSTLSKFDFETWIFQRAAGELFGQFHKIGRAEKTAAGGLDTARVPVTIGPFESAPARAHYTFHFLRRASNTPWLLTDIERKEKPP